MSKITVVIPVGSDPVYLEWLPECVESVLNQTRPPDEILFIQDGSTSVESLSIVATYNVIDIMKLFDRYSEPLKYRRTYGVYGVEAWSWEEPPPDREFWITKWCSPWKVGVSDAFNFGVALANNNLVFMLGSDDTLAPTCLGECVKEYEKQKIEGWYNVTIKTSSGERSWIPNHAAMVTKKLWEYTGGFGPSAFAGPDAWLLSILMKHDPKRILQVKQGTPLYFVREHEHQDTKKTAWVFSDEMISIRNKETERWKSQS